MAGLSYKQVGAIMRSRAVRDAVDATADKVASRVQAAAGDSIPVGRVNGTRPLGRPYGRVTLPTSAEHGGPGVPRRRILARVAAEFRR